MNQQCKVCGEPAAGFHFGAFTCEGCKSFFGRTYNNLSQIHECKNGGNCVINKQNRTSCKACRLKKCVVVGMSKSGSRYGRRSNWFKIHCLLQEQAAQVSKNLEAGGGSIRSTSTPPATSLSPNPYTRLTPPHSQPNLKTDGSSFSSPESMSSTNGWKLNFNPNHLGLKRDPPDPNLRDRIPAGSDFVANFGLYSLHPGLSLLQASQFYSRLYPPMLYPTLANAQFLQNTSPREPPFLLSQNLITPNNLSNLSSSSSSPNSSPRNLPKEGSRSPTLNEENLEIQNARRSYSNSPKEDRDSSRLKSQENTEEVKSELINTYSKKRRLYSPTDELQSKRIKYDYRSEISLPKNEADYSAENHFYKKRKLDSPPENKIFNPSTSYDIPIDLTVKRRRLNPIQTSFSSSQSPNRSPSPNIELKVDTKPPILQLLPIPTLNTAPVNLSTKA